MSTGFESVQDDFLKVVAGAKELVGEFLYAPMGIESSTTLNSATFYVLVGLCVVIIFRLLQPAHHSRYRRDQDDIHYGR